MTYRSRNMFSFRRRLSMWAFKCLQFTYRHIFRSTTMIFRIPFYGALMKLASPQLSQEEISIAKEGLRIDIVANQVSALHTKGFTKISFYILRVEQLGDIIACEPICHYLKQLAPASSITWLVRPKFAEILKTFPLVDKVITIESIADGFDFCAKMRGKPESIIVNTHFDNILDPITKRLLRNPCNPDISPNTYYYYGSLLQAFCLVAGLPQLAESPTLILSELNRGFQLPQDYVVFHCHSADCARDWTNDKWNEIASWLMGIGMAVVEIGMVKTVFSPNTLFYDLTGRRNILDLASIIRDAKVFVGVDSSFAHVANAFHVPSAILLGRYTYFDSYFPYSGDFAHSELFKCVRAPAGQYAKSIPVEAVKEALTALTTQPQSRVGAS